MNEALGIFLIVGTLIGCLALGVLVAVSLLLSGIVGMLLFSSAPIDRALSSNLWSSSSEWTLAALPLFIWMGEILFRSRMSDDLFSGLSPWMQRLPGRLSHVPVMACGIFAAVSGSSAATCATVAKVAVPELRKRGYDEQLVLGTIAGSATLGLLIPPSIIMIVYGVATEVSIARLFIAGIVPGTLVVGLYMGYIMLWSWANPARVPPADAPMPLKAKVRSSGRLIPIVALIGGVIGSIYLGIASPTDSAAVGVVLALLLSWLFGDLNRKTFKAGLFSTAMTSCMIAFILAGAAFLTLSMGYSGLPGKLAAGIGSMGLSIYTLLAALTVFFIFLGMFLDGISIIVLTTSVLLPMVQAAGIDPLWFGIYLVLVVEMGQITPPVGLNLFVLQGMTGRSLVYLSWAAFPFFMILIIAVMILVMFPGVVTWLPQQMLG
ncbi:TRAP transporter large permease subunit [Paracoccus sp. Z118]|uniref:TRAP transporter large permease n=1 Tax=Paracoccus sp. Z118 TaxID=2851017 RepID=UPI001C2C2EDD|nr:TRAP transporter large permease subunit [Paracoccus sp. Z118]MBV0893297.1 TRAP transporter large permease subunit [Paracoccus sp. Z118]